MNTKTVLFMGALCVLSVVGCKDDTNDPDETKEACTEQACFDQCRNGEWAAFQESYWAFEAMCDDDETCRCISRCDDDLCNVDHCQDDLGLAGGSCQFLGCECGGGDAGPSDTEDPTD